ncbi:hypothetical protein SH668x_003116 [Planctomicrobium sp. SH668]|uniref:hypothetical protein n=1 Tax=Planctomicrobium sp. SH668 TaxID=3448126 RepID=UPI003F5B7E51
MPVIAETIQEPAVLEQLSSVVWALIGLGNALTSLLLPWTPLFAWIVFWLVIVDWRKLYPVIMNGALTSAVLLGMLAVLIWASIAFPEGNLHHLFGLKVHNFIGKFVYVTALFIIAALCGSVQLSGRHPISQVEANFSPEEEHA